MKNKSVVRENCCLGMFIHQFVVGCGKQTGRFEQNESYNKGFPKVLHGFKHPVVSSETAVQILKFFGTNPFRASVF